jgi:PAS domain S-box-containing protein
METKPVKSQIGIICDSPQEHVYLVDLLSTHTQFETTLLDARNTSIVGESIKWDVALYCVFSDEQHSHITDFVTQIVQHTPVIVLLDHPTVDHTVDLMRAGSSGVADWRDSQRVLDLIKAVLDVGSMSASQAIYRSIVDTQTELICRYDADLRLLFVNRAYAEWQGVPDEALIGTRITEKIPAEDRGRATAHIGALTADNPVAVSIHSTVLPDGSIRTVEWMDRAIFNTAGQLIEYQGVGRDVTEREERAKELATYRAHFDGVLETMQDALMSISLPDRHVIFVSHAFEEVLGYSPERFIKDRDFFQQIVHPDDLEHATQAMQTCLTEGFVELDHRIIWPDGQIRWIHRRAWINYDEGGQPTRVNDSSRDITARKKVEEALRSSDAHLKSLIDSQTNYLIRTDLDGRYTYWNPKFEREFGWLHEPHGMPGSVSLHSIMPYHHQRTMEVVAKCFAEPDIPFQVELDKPGPDGSVCTTLWEFICLTDASEVPTAFQCVGINITQQKKAQATMQYQANLLQQVSDAIIATDSDQRITSWNRAATDIYGWAEAEAIGQKLDELLRTEWFAESQSSAQASVAQTGHWHGEIRQIDKAGEQHYVVASVNLLYDEQGEPIGGVTVNRDITLQKRRDTLQEQISQTLEATAERQQMPVILEKLVLAVEEFEPDIQASVLLLDPRTNQLRHGAAPSLPNAYNEAIDGLHIGSGAGSCGTAAYERRLVVVEDIATDPLWKDFKGLAAKHGLQACWSQPIIGHRERVLGTFALYYAETRQPSTDELDLIRLAARIAGLVIEHAQAETDLTESEEKYRSLVESSEAAIAVFDIDGNLQFANTIAAAQLGASPTSVIGKNMHELFPPDVADFQLTSIRNVIRTGQGSVSEAPSYVSGEHRWYRTSIQPIRNASGEIRTALIYASDITQFKSIEEALRQSEVQFQQFMRYLPGAMFIKDNAERTIYCNERYAAVSGTTPQHIIGKRSQEYMAEDLATPFIRENEIVLAENRAMEFHQSFPSEDGFSHWLTIKFPIPREGQPPLLGAISLDITREKQAEETIKRSEKRYRLMFEQVNLPKLITDPQTSRILDANPAAVDFYGYSLRVLKSMTMLQINIAAPEVILKKMQQVLDGEIDSCLFVQRLADGTVRDVEGFAVGIELDGQQVLYWTYIDVTERNRAHAALEQANQTLEQRVQERTRALEQAKDRIEAIFNHSGDGIVLLDTDLTIQQSNYAFERMFAIPHDTVFDKPLFELMSEEDRATIFDLLADVVPRHETRRMEIRGRRLDGTIFDAEISIAPVNRSDKRVENIVCIVRDVSERKQAEVERQKYITEIEDLYNNAPAGYHSLDSAGFFVQINDTELDWLGYTREEVVSTLKFSELLTPQSQQSFRERFPLLQQNGEIDSVEFEMVCKDGSTIWVLGSASIVRDDVGNFVRSRATLYDITELKEKTEALRVSEQRLRESENMLHLVLDTIPVRVFWKNRDSVYLGCNRLFAQDAGLSSKDDIVGKRDDELRGLQVDASSYQEGDSTVIESGLPNLNYEETVRTADGRELIVLTNKLPLQNAQHEVIGLLGAYIDITEQRKADAQLRYLASLQAHMYDAVIGTDLDYHIQSWNRAAERMFGWRAEEVMGRLLGDVLKTDIMGGTTESASTQLLAKGYWQGEAIQRHRDGSTVHVLGSIVLNHNQHGQPIGVIGVNHDITERKQAEEQLRVTTERLQLATEAGEIGIWDFEPEQNRMHWDDRMFSLYGIDDPQVTPSNELWMSLVHGDDLEQALADTYAARMGERPYELEFRVVTSAGEIRHIRAKAKIFSEDHGKRQRVVGVNIDITQQKVAEETLRRALEKEKELGELKSRFVSMASHQFRTPLAAILANTETLSIYRDRMDSTQIDTRLDRIRKQVNYMKAIMEDVLELARIQANQVQYQPIQGNLDMVCKEIIEDFEHQEDYAGRIIYDGPDAPLDTEFDPHLMHHLVSNLIHNALKYSEDEQTVYVTLSRTAHEITLRVKDQGIGIPPEDLQHIFTPFFRAGNVEAIAGTGLGLSIVKQAVSAHAGTITIESTPKVGSTFVVTLPIQHAEDN